MFTVYPGKKFAFFKKKNISYISSHEKAKKEFLVSYKKFFLLKEGLTYLSYFLKY